MFYHVEVSILNYIGIFDQSEYFQSAQFIRESLVSMSAETSSDCKIELDDTDSVLVRLALNLIQRELGNLNWPAENDFRSREQKHPARHRDLLFHSMI